MSSRIIFLLATHIILPTIALAYITKYVDHDYTDKYLSFGHDLIEYEPVQTFLDDIHNKPLDPK